MKIVAKCTLHTPKGLLARSHYIHVKPASDTVSPPCPKNSALQRLKKGPKVAVLAAHETVMRFVRFWTLLETNFPSTAL